MVDSAGAELRLPTDYTLKLIMGPKSSIKLLSGSLSYLVVLFCYFLGLGSYLSSLSPYIVENYPENGSWLLFIGQLAYPLGYLFSGYISDRSRLIRIWLLMGLVFLPLSQLLLFVDDGNFWRSMCYAAASRFFLSANLQWISIAILEDSDSGSYARKRTAGTLGFAVIQLILWLGSTWIEGRGLNPDWQETGSIGCLFYIPCLILAVRVRKKRLAHDVFKFRQAWQALANSNGRIFLLIGFIYFFAFQIIDNFLGAFLNMAGGKQLVFSGWLIAVLLEVPWLWVTGWIVKKAGERSLLAIAAVCGGLRFGGYALYLLDDRIPLLALQLLHGIQFMSYYIGAIFWLRNHYPNHIYGSVSGIYYIVAHALGAVLGNLFFGWQLGFTNLNMTIGPNTIQDPQLKAWFVMFMIASFLNLLILPLFGLLKGKSKIS